MFNCVFFLNVQSLVPPGQPPVSVSKVGLKLSDPFTLECDDLSFMEIALHSLKVLLAFLA